MPPGAGAAEVFERRVRPIYDALDNRNYKGALKQCDALLDKYPVNHLILSLKGYALVRQGKAQDAGKMCNMVLGSLPVDDAAVQVLCMVLKELHRPQDITHVHEAAAQRAASDPEALAALFFAYAREGRHDKQQQVAMKLLKASGSAGRYQWWVITSLALQARWPAPTAHAAPGSGPPPLPPAQLLQLAESMAARAMGKAVQGGEGFEALLLQLDLLLARRKPDAALAAVEQAAGLGLAAQPQELGALQVDLRVATGDLQGAAARLRQRLEANPDDWAAWHAYLDCCLPQSVRHGTSLAAPEQLVHNSSLLWFDGGLAQQHHHQHQLAGAESGGQEATVPLTAPAQEREPAALAAECASLIATLQSADSVSVTQGGKVCRGLLLASVELAWRQCLMSSPACAQHTAALEQLAVAVVEYWRAAGHLLSCAADVRGYTRHLRGKQAQWVWAALGGNDLLAVPDSWDDGVAGLQRRVSALQLCSDLADPMPELGDVGSSVSHAGCLVTLYSCPATRALYAKLDVREAGPADMLPCLAANTVMQAACQAERVPDAARAMAWAMLCLEAAAATRPHAVPVRLALVALHGLLGHGVGAARHMTALEVKHIQLESLCAHHLLPSLLALGSLERAQPQAPPAASAAAGGAGKAGPIVTSRTLGRVLRDTHALFQDHCRDAGDSLEAAYRQGMYSKVLEFEAFRRRLASSISSAVVRSQLLAAPLRHAAAYAAPDTPLAAVLADAATAVLVAGEGLPPGPGGGALLPWTLLPQPKLLTFNHDLATRPGWWPPTGGALSALGPALWWAQRSGCAATARGHGAWWSQPRPITESCSGREPTPPELLDLRAAQAQAVKAEWAAMHALLHVLQGMQGGAVPEGTLASDAQHAVYELAASLGWDTLPPSQTASALDAWLLAQPTAWSLASAQRHAQLATCLVLAAGVAVIQASSSEGNADVAAARLRAAGEHVVEAVAGMAALLADDSAAGSATESSMAVPLPGGMLTLPAVLLSEPTAWLVAVLEGMSQAAKQAGRGRGSGRKAGNGQTAEASQQLGELRACAKNVARLCAGPLRRLGETLGMLQKAAERQVALGSDRLEANLVDGSMAGTSSLWAWQDEPGAHFKAGSVLAQLAACHRDSTACLSSLAVQLAARCTRVDSAA